MHVLVICIRAFCRHMFELQIIGQLLEEESRRCFTDRTHAHLSICAMEPIIRVEDLVAEAGVKDIDQECSNKDLLHLADYCYPWRVVGGHLKLSELELGDIDDDNKSSELKRLGVLQKWKQKSFKATYRMLVSALISCKRNQQAREVCQYLARKEAEQINKVAQTTHARTTVINDRTPCKSGAAVPGNFSCAGEDVDTSTSTEALASQDQGSTKNGKTHRKTTHSQCTGNCFYLIAAVPVVIAILLAVAFSLRGGDNIVASNTYSNDVNDRSLPHKPTLPQMNSLDEDRDRDHPAPNTHSSSYSSKRKDFPHMNERPTMPELSNLKRSGGQSPVKIIERIGGEKSLDLGGILLKDEHGVRMKNIKHEERSVEAVNREMFRQWLQGGGARVSWKALVDALDTVGLNTLANDMIDALGNADY